MEYVIDKMRRGESTTVDGLVEFLFRGVDQPHKGGRNAVRTLLHRVRLELRRHFDAEYRGHAAPYTVDIRLVEGHCEVEVVSPRAVARGLNDDFERFWASCMLAREDPIIQASARVFLRVGDNLFIRDVHMQQGGDIDEILRQLGIDPKALTEDQRNRIKRTRHFVSAGETAGMLHLADGFLTRGRIVRFGNLPRYGRSRGDANLIQVGLPRMDDLRVYTMVQGERFYLVPNGVADRTASQQPFYREQEFCVTGEDPFDISVEEADRFAIVTRIPNCDPNYSVTAISSNHGRATEAVCQYLADSVTLGRILDRLSTGQQDPPSRFQVVFRVKLLRQGEREVAKGELDIVGIEPNLVGHVIESGS